MRKSGLIVTVLGALTLALTGCGGGSNTSAFAGSASSSGGTKGAASISVLTSMPQLPSDNSKSATVTAIVSDSNNNAVSGAKVLFSATSGLISGSPATTDANGMATATLSTAGDPTSRVITVSSTTGTVSSTVQVGVVGTTISLTGPKDLAQSTQGTYTVALADSAKNPIAGKTVAVSSSAGNTLSAASLTTNALGNATFQLTGSNTGADTVSATALGLTATQTLSVSNQNFAFTTPIVTAPATSAMIPLTLMTAGTPPTPATVTPVTIVWKTGAAVQAGQTITFTTTRGLFFDAGTKASAVSTTVVTDTNGSATVQIYSTTAGPATVAASAPGVGAQLALTFVAANASTIDLQASPATVVTQGQSTISAIVRDANNNLVQGQTVTFQLTDVTGGALSVASAITDVQGRAQTVYTASSTASATNGVIVTADVLNASPAVTATTRLTVGGQTVFLSLGTGSQLFENASKTQFIVPFIVQAQDSAGNAVDGVNVTLKVHSIAYAKGGWIVGPTSWVQSGTPGVKYPTDGTSPPAPAVCPNEDLNGNGILDNNEDTTGLGNGNGRLDPGDVASVSPGSVTTAVTTITTGSSSVTTHGSAALTVSYPEDHALWVAVVLTATATVQGTESSTTSTFWLPILASYVTTTTASPPGVYSPYGIGKLCTDPN